LAELAPFDTKKNIIEEMLAPERPLASMTLQEFSDETSRDSTAPGGGSVAALAGAMGAALAAMVANLPHPKAAFAGVREELESIAVRGQEVKQCLLDAIDDDTWAFQKVMEAGKLPAAQKEAALREATLGAAAVPLTVVEVCPEIVDLCRRSLDAGMKASGSDAGVGATMARSAAVGAAMNVYINLQDMADDPEAAEMLRKADAALKATEAAAEALVSEVWRRLSRE
jgi:glutamate formiminotransferase/formiminotetrahydrofolate cyclodeaminase